jgi:hypothetical protein
MKRFLLTFILLLGVLAARTENIVSVSSVSGHPQDELTVQLSLVHTDAAVAFQVEIPLGSQLTYVPGSVALNPDRITDHQVSAAVVNGSLRIYVFSLSLTPFVGTEGNLLSFNLKLKNEPGNYALELNQAKLSNASGNALSVTTNNGMVTILAPKLQINTASINYGHVPIRSEYTQNARVTNVGNEPLTITGISFSDPVFGCPGFAETTLQPNGSASFAFLFSPEEKGAVIATATIASNSISGIGAVSLVADPFAVNEIHIGNTTGYCDSVVEVPINMNNMEAITGLQIDMNLPQTLEYVDFRLSERKTDHVAMGVFKEGLLRLMAYSASGAAFSGDDGEIGILLLRLKGLSGNYGLNPSKAVLADANGEDVLSAKYQGRVTIRSPKINGSNALSFGSSPVTETVTREYVVRNQGNASMRIDQVVFDQTDFSLSETFPIVVAQGANTTLHVSYDREQQGDFNALMKIYSNDPQNGLMNVALSGTRYEPNALALSADAFASSEGNVEVSLAMDNYSDIVAMQFDFTFPYLDFSVQSSDFMLAERCAQHSLYTTPLNDSTYRVLVLSMQNGAVVGHEGVVLNVVLHPIGTPEDVEYTVSTSNTVLSGREGTNLLSGDEAEARFVLTMTQNSQMEAGWNWWSTYIEQNNMDGLTMLENQLGENGLEIKSQSSTTVNYYSYMGYDYWYGSLNEIQNEKGYKINVSSASNTNLTGRKANVVNHPITIRSNWNWIGYPLAYSQTISSAFTGFQPAPNDLIKGQGMSSIYYEGYGWFPDVVLEPNKSYMYQSLVSEDKTLVYANNRGVDVQRVEEQPYWQSNVYAYPNNSSVIAVAHLDGLEQRDGEVQIGAFVNGECRGSASLTYFEPLGRYYGVLTITGQDGDLIEFRLADIEKGETSVDCKTQLVFETDAVMGNLNDPLELQFDSKENVNHPSRVQFCPNPVKAGQSFSLIIPNEEKVSEVLVTNTFGVLTQHQKSDALSVNAPTVSGVYIVTVICQSGMVCHNQIIVK